MELNNTTEEEYTRVMNRLIEINVSVPTGVKIMAQIVGICNAIAIGNSGNDISTAFNLGCGGNSFSAIFKRTTGVSVTDIPKMTAYDKRAIRLKQRAYSEEQIKEILGVIDGN